VRAVDSSPDFLVPTGEGRYQELYQEIWYIERMYQGFVTKKLYAANPLRFRHQHGVIDSGWGTTRTEDAQGTPTQSHVPPSVLGFADKRRRILQEKSFNLKLSGNEVDCTNVLLLKINMLCSKLHCHEVFILKLFPYTV